MRRLSRWGLLGGLAVVLAGASYFLLNHDFNSSGNLLARSAGPHANASSAPPEKVVTVEAAPVTLDTVLETIHAVATLNANESVLVAPEIAGRIGRLPFKEGQRVKAGDVLVELDDTILRAELEKARSDLTLAAANRDRALTLARQETGSLRARDEAVAAYESAQADFALAEARLSKSRVLAPLSGEVGLRAVSVGAYVTPGEQIVELAQTDPIKVDFRVPELALTNLRAGQTVKVTVDALPGRTFNGEVYVIDPIIDANGRAVRLRARIANPVGALRPGLFARVQIVLAQRDNALLVPEAAVLADNQERFVFRVVDGRAVRTVVELGLRRPGQVEIRSGLAPDAVVVTAGHQQVRNGNRVTIAGG